MNVSKYLYLILFLFLFITCKEDDGPQLATYSFTSDFPIVHQKIDDIIKREFAYQNMVGLNVAVIQNGQVIHRKGYGYRDAGSLLPVTTENVFYMNSISKPITAVLAQLLSDYLEDDFNWDDPIINHSTYYATAPCNAINDGWRNLITTKGLLSNTAGVPHYCEVFWENGSTTYANGGGWKGTMESTRLIDVFCHAPLLMPQSANQYRYSSFGYNLAGCVINDVGKEHLNKGYYELADEWLRDGWGMNNLVPDDGARPGKPLRYSMSCVGEVFVEPNTEDRTWALPGSGWLINPNDLAKFGNHLLEGKVQTDQLWESVGNIPEIGCDGDNLG
ncbi:MAG: beta-lactamase family protein, partial [Bacteroidia bacterium]|nr:beta-lactamase family protein [Bacteroidia bacterium]